MASKPKHGFSAAGTDANARDHELRGHALIVDLNLKGATPSSANIHRLHTRTDVRQLADSLVDGPLEGAFARSDRFFELAGALYEDNVAHPNRLVLGLDGRHFNKALLQAAQPFLSYAPEFKKEIDRSGEPPDTGNIEKLFQGSLDRISRLVGVSTRHDAWKNPPLDPAPVTAIIREAYALQELYYDKKYSRLVFPSDYLILPRSSYSDPIQWLSGLIEDLAKRDPVARPGLIKMGEAIRLTQQTAFGEMDKARRAALPPLGEKREKFRKGRPPGSPKRGPREERPVPA
jgi:hypothetical protein